MSVAIGLWSIVLKPGVEHEIIPQGDLRITNVALGEELADASGRSTVKLSFLPMSAMAMDDEDEEEDEPKLSSEDISTAVICSLIGGKIESTTVDIVLEEENEYILQVSGKNEVHIIGNYIDQTPMNMPPGGYDSEDDSDDEDAYDLRDVSSDVMMEGDELESDAERFEELDEEEEAPATKKSSKRPRPSEEAESAEPLTKAQKKAAKKQKAADGSAVPAASESASAKEKKEKQPKEKEGKKEKADKPVEKTLAGGLKIIDATIGTGPAAKKGSTCRMRYIGKLENGRVFDKNTGGTPFTFKLGVGEVIKGWDEGIVGMQPGGERTLIVPPALAYGKKKTGDIPANSTLKFEVKLLEVKK